MATATALRFTIEASTTGFEQEPWIWYVVGNRPDWADDLVWGNFPTWAEAMQFALSALAA